MSLVWDVDFWAFLDRLLALFKQCLVWPLAWNAGAGVFSPLLSSCSVPLIPVLAQRSTGSQGLSHTQLPASVIG